MELLKTDLLNLKKPIEGYYNGMYIQMHPSSNDKVYIYVPSISTRKYVHKANVIEALKDLEWTYRVNKYLSTTDNSNEAAEYAAGMSLEELRYLDKEYVEMYYILDDMDQAIECFDSEKEAIAYLDNQSKEVQNELRIESCI